MNLINWIMQLLTFLIPTRPQKPKVVVQNAEAPQEQPQPEPTTSKYCWILDNGHGLLTKGKRSPKLSNGKRFYEYHYNRIIVRGLCDMLNKYGIDYVNLVPEDECGNMLKERVARANSILTDKQRIFVSIHGNAGPGDAKGWTTANGLETWHLHDSMVSYRLASIFQRNIVKATGLKDRGVKSKPTGQFYVLRNTEMPAILTENGFFNNFNEVHNMLDDFFVSTVIEGHLHAILELEKDFCSTNL